MQPHSGRLERGEVKAELRGFGVRCWLKLDVCGGLWSSVIGDFYYRVCFKGNLESVNQILYYAAQW